MINCESCDDMVCDSWHSFFTHVYVAHPTQRWFLTRKVFNVSGRSKSEIVSDANTTWLSEYVI